MTKTKQTEAQAHPVGELAAMLESALKHGEMPQALFNVIVDYFQEKIEVTGLEAPIPPIAERRVMELVLAAERRRELFVEQQERARLKSPAREATHQGEAHEQASVEVEEAPPPSHALAAHLAAVMAHPETPTPLYNAMADQLNSMLTDVNLYTLDMIERMLEGFKKQKAEEKGGHANG